jgi:hypothetical protein
VSASAIAINVAVAVLLVFAALLTLGLCRAAGRPTPAKETRGLRVWDFDAEAWVDLPAGARPGPGQMTSRQIEDADDLELLWLSRPYVRPAGLERLWDAARDHHTNTPEGDSK